MDWVANMLTLRYTHLVSGSQSERIQYELLAMAEASNVPEIRLALRLNTS